MVSNLSNKEEKNQYLDQMIVKIPMMKICLRYKPNNLNKIICQNKNQLKRKEMFI